MSNPFGGGPPPGGPPPGGPFGPPPGGGGFGTPPPGGGGFGQPPGGGGFGPPPGGGGFGQPPAGPGGYGSPNPFGAPVAQAIPAVPINQGPAMFLGIFVAMFCGCVPGGVIAILLAHQAKQAADRGDSAGAESKLRLSYIASGASIGLLFLGTCLYTALMIVAEM